MHSRSGAEYREGIKTSTYLLAVGKDAPKVNPEKANTKYSNTIKRDTYNPL